MLEENKQIYRQCAEVNLPNWKELSKSQLCNIYIDEKSTKGQKEGAIAAIIYKCWNIFHHNYRNQPYIPIEDWYDSMIESILYVLQKHVWTDPNNLLYGKEIGPEMALHRCIYSRKINIYLLSKKPKRVINLNTVSTEDLKERAGVDPYCEIDDDACVFQQYIKALAEKGKLQYCIILDLILQGVKPDGLAKEIRQLNDVYVDYFAKRYSVEKTEVDKVIKDWYNNKDLGKYVDYYLTCLSRDEDTIEYLK